MTSKIFPTFIIIFLLLHPLLSETVLTSLNTKKSQPFEFLKHLVGCQKGDKLKGIHELKMYLEKFGYLNYDSSYSHLNNQSHVFDDYFDDNIESAIKTYQLNYNLYPTGSLDVKTVSKMMMPRCGVADIINDTSRMHSGKKMNHSTLNSFHTDYTFGEGKPKWPKLTLTYGYPPNTRSDAHMPIIDAFKKWEARTKLKFVQTNDYANADLKISFQKYEHGDGAPFDGPGGILAHASLPTDGNCHFDDSEPWAVGAFENTIDIRSVALHEIGHNLGLEHSSDPEAIMFPTFEFGIVKGLSHDDIHGIRVLYNFE